jgi:hypothetical protein
VPSSHDDDVRREAQAIMRIAGSELEAYHMLERQLNVLVLRTQVLLSLSGIVITVTGFSGRAIAETGALARTCISIGIAVVLASAVTAIAGVLRLRWLSETLGPEPLENIVAGLRIRDSKARFLNVSLVLFVVGFSFYVTAVIQLLVAAGGPGL